MWYLFTGNWTRSQVKGYHNDTITSTSTPKASFFFAFSGTWIVCISLCWVVLMLSPKQGLSWCSMVAYRTPLTGVENTPPIRLGNTQSTVCLVGLSTETPHLQTLT